MVMKFDRTSGNYVYTTLNESESFVGDGGTTEFVLKWPMNLSTNNISLTVDGVDVLSSEFTVSNISNDDSGYTVWYGQISFVNPPATGAEIVVEYKKATQLLHAADRINFHYNPTTGMLGKDLGQLMDGINYDGVQIDSIDFGEERGFDTGSFGASAFDTYDINAEDEIFVLDGSTLSLELSKPLEAGVVYNFYKNNVRLDDPFWDGSSVTANSNAVMASIIGDGITTTILIDNDVVSTADGDIIVIRKSTSDGSFTPDATSFDVQLGGGNFELTTARGIESGDIVVDGDGFVTPTTSRGPEEQVPGQVMDTLDMRVYNRVPDGQGVITVQNFKTDGSTTRFPIFSLPQISTSTIVKLNNTVVDPSQYSFDTTTMELVIDNITSPDQNLSLLMIGNNGNDILDSDRFVGDGNTVRFETGLKYRDNISTFVTVNAELALPTIARSDNDNVLLEFGTAPDSGEVIQYTIYDGLVKDFSQLVIDNTFIANGTEFYHKFGQTDISLIPYNEKPYGHKILVKSDNTFLRAGYSIKHTLTVERAYDIQSWQFADISLIRQGDVLVYIEGELVGNDVWTYDTINGRIQLLKENVGLPGEKMEVFVIRDADYYFVDTVVTVTNISAPHVYSEGDEIVFRLTDDSTTFTGIVQEYSQTGDTATIKLRGYARELVTLASIDNTPVQIGDFDSSVSAITDITFVESEYLTFATPPASGADVAIYLFSNHDINQFERTSYNIVYDTVYIADETVDGYLDRNLLTNGYVRLRNRAVSAEYVWVIKDGDLLTPNVDYILLPNKETIKIFAEMIPSQYVEVIEFTAPVSKPKFGFRMFKDILNRTHYKRLNRDNEYELAEPLNYYDLNIVLKDATGIEQPNRNIGVPGIIWIDGERIEYFLVEGNLLRQLRRGTLGTGTKLQYPRGTTVAGQGSSENIPYKDEIITWTAIGDGSTQDFVLDWTPSSINEFEVFVGGIKLINHERIVFDHTIAQTSPEGDVIVPAEYTLEDNILSLATPPASSVLIKIVRKLGKVWNDPGKSLEDSNNQIANFIKDKTISLPR